MMLSMIAENRTNEKTLKVFALLRSGVNLSRNRHYELFRDPSVQRAKWLYRVFVSLQRDVSQDLQNVLIFSPLPSQNTYRYGLSVQLPTLKGIRTVYLSARELRLFAESAPNQNAVLLCHLSQIANQEVSVE